jgi:hypothetical protein
MHRTVTGLLLGAVAFIGLAHIAFLPPFEGFDETAHWSYIQELADLGHPPRYGTDALSMDTDHYSGPMTYSGAPPYDKTGRPTFRSYRQKGDQPILDGPGRYAPDKAPNWQAQHPPLYYGLMAPVYLAAKGLRWVPHLMVMRLASFALAFAGFALGVLGTARLTADAPSGVKESGMAPRGAWTGPIMAAWPFLFPQFFPEFARLGNDSLCLLLASAAWVLTLRQLRGRGGWRSALALGVVLGLGLLTKAFFLPIGASVGLLLLAFWWLNGRRSDAMIRGGLTASMALLIGGWWYLTKTLETGSVTGSDEFIRLHQAGGVAALADGFSLSEFAKGGLIIVTTFLWAGTWSLARLPEIALAAPAAILLVTSYDYIRRLWTPERPRADLAAWAPLVFAIPMGAGLVYHVMVWMAGTSAVTPGWYFHILAAPLGFAVALGWRRPRVLGALTALTGIYTAVAWTFQLSLFSGCAAKLGANEDYDLTGAGCFIDPHALQVVGAPTLGFASLAAGLGLGLYAAFLAWRAFKFGLLAPVARIAL